MLPVASSCETKDDQALGPLLLHSRVLLVAAHPDDETVGAGVLLSRLKQPRVVHVTDGSPPNLADASAAGFSSRETYAEARALEVRRALAIAGVREHQVERLGFTDQRASFCLPELVLETLDLLRRHAPDVLLTHAYEGGHPDHDSIAFACHSASQLYRSENPRASVELHEFAGYHGRDGQLRTYEFLPRPDVPQCRAVLDPSEEALKSRMLGAFATQAGTLRSFLPPKVEIFRVAPRYDFTRPPHTGKLFYENFAWGVDGREWRALAVAALRLLRNRGALS